MAERRDISIAEVLEAARAAWALDLHTALPGIVREYFELTKTATVQPAVRRAIDGVDGATAFEEIPAIPNVPVAWPSAGGFELHLPLVAGDTVLLVFSEADTTKFEDTGEVSDPGWLERHGLGSPVAYPYRRTPSNATGANLVAPSAFSVGAAGSAEFVALANLVGAQLADLKSAISGWTPASNDGGAALKVALTDWLASSSDVACTKLKAE